MTLSAVAQSVPAPTHDEVTAVYTDEAPRIDGHLDDAVWDRIAPITQFTQVWPEDGAEATERSEVRIAYDRDYLYFAFKFYDNDPHLIRAKNLERGGRNDRDDHAYISLDTYRDGRNAYLFEMNALGTQDDATITDERLTIDSFSWDAVFWSETVIDEEGWSMEVAIPFRQIRFPKGDDLEFGLMLSRTINRKNERVLWPAIGLEFGGSFAALAAVSQYGTLKGLQNVRRGNNLEIKPYGITGLQNVRPDFGVDSTDTDFDYDFGVDVKYGLTSSLTLDLTVNTDFAQVEADNVQLNLTRFNLFFPEKREFFLERSGLFDHGDLRSTQTFFSRRIGLAEQILAGARLTGQIGRFAVGFLNIETGENLGDFLSSKSANNMVARIRTNVMPRATTGAIFTNLWRDGGYNRALGVDAQYRFWGSSLLQGWYTQVWDSDPLQDDAAGHVSLRLRNETYGGTLWYTNVGRRYNPALGFVRRRDMRQYYTNLNYRPTVDWEAAPFIRRFSFQGEFGYTEGQDGKKQSSEFEVSTRAEFNQRDFARVEFSRSFERILFPFGIGGGRANVPVADYTFNRISLGAGTDQSRRFFVQGYTNFGDFFQGTRQDFGGSVGFRQSQHFTIEAGLDYSKIDLGTDGAFDATTLSTSILAALNRKLFAKALIQYDNFSRDLQANIRINWIHTPGSDLFLVFNTAYHFVADNERDALFDPRRDVIRRDQVGVVKLTYLVLL